MIKTICVFSMAIGLAASLSAQEVSPVLLVASKSQVAYLSPGDSTGQTVFNGAVLQKSGSVHMMGRGSATLFCDGQFRQIKGKTPQALAEVFPETGGLVGLSFDATFGDYLMAAVSMAAASVNNSDAWASVKTTKGSGDGWASIKTVKNTGDGRTGADALNSLQDGWGSIRTSKGSGDGWGSIKATKGAGDGWGGKGPQFNALQPYGKVRPEHVKLIWSKPSGNPTFKVEIRDQKGAVVMDTTTKDTFWMPAASSAALAEGSLYEWKVTATGELIELSSNGLIFEMAKASELEATLQIAEKAPLYQSSQDDVRKLMQAIALERADWFTEAAGVYAALQKAHPGNQMIKIMHAAFWMRQGLKPLAERVYSVK